VAGNDLSRAYASALLEIGQEQNMLSRIEEELGFVASLVRQDRDLMLYLNSPGVSKEAKKGFIDRALGGELSEITINFLKVVIDNDRQLSIGEIHASLIELIDVLNNRQHVCVTSSAKLNSDMLKKIKDSLESKFKKEIIVDEVVDEKIIGGIVIRIGDLIIDGSISKDLRNIKDKLLYSKVRSEAAYED
jgi:F-type H+-transporting ATPase subunit delta